LKRRTYAFFRDELITMAPALTAAVVAIAVAPFLPRDFLLFLSVLAILAISAALAAYTLPPVRAARARLIAARHIPDSQL
jgi:hypothetical protein